MSMPSADLVPHGRLEAAERKVPGVGLEPRARKAKRRGSPVAASRSIAGPPGKPRPSMRATLSKASPAASSRVRPRRRYWPWPSARTRSVWPPETISATSGKRSARRLVEARPVQPVGVHVAFEVIDAQQWLAPREGQPLGHVDADQQRAGQARARGLRRSRRSPSQSRVRRGKGLFQRRQDRPQVRARRLFGHHTAVARVQVGLRGDDVGLDLAAPSRTTATAVSSQLVSMPRMRVTQREYRRPARPRRPAPYSRRPSRLDSICANTRPARAHAAAR